MRTVEIDAANALLDTRVRIHVPAPRIFRWLGVKSWRYSLYRPVCAQLLRISRLYVSMGIEESELESEETGVQLETVSHHLVDASRLVALGMIRGGVRSYLFHRLLARYLRCHSDTKTLSELAKMVVAFSGAENFMPIIRSIGHLKITEPNLSQVRTES